VRRTAASNAQWQIALPITASNVWYGVTANYGPFDTACDTVTGGMSGGDAISMTNAGTWYAEMGYRYFDETLCTGQHDLARADPRSDRRHPHGQFRHSPEQRRAQRDLVLLVEDSRMSAKIVVAVVTSLSILGALILRTHREKEESARLHDEVAALAASVARIQQRPETVRIIEDRAVVERAETASPSASDGGRPDPSDEVQRKQAMVEAMPVILDTKFSREPPDRHWSSETQSRLRDEFSRVQMPGSEMTSIECKSTLCRLQGIFEAKEAFNEMMHGVFGSTDPEHRVAHGGAVAPVVEQLGDGRMRATIYMAREGDRLVDSDLQ
jgi:hypothetical protein